MMLAELNHRVKNTLATVQALARHSRSSAVTLDAYVHSFEQRIQAMAASHNLLSDAAWRAVDLHTLITEQLLPYAQVGDNLRLDGDACPFSRRWAPPSAWCSTSWRRTRQSTVRSPCREGVSASRGRSPAMRPHAFCDCFGAKRWAAR